MPDSRKNPLSGDTPLTLEERDFRHLAALVQQESGIHLTDAKRPLIIGRLSRRLRDLSLGSIHDYCRHIARDGGKEEIVHLIDCLATNETRFFREPCQFTFFEKYFFPAWAARGHGARGERHLRAWSAACSTGEEPYTLAMLLSHHFPSTEGWSVDILATDISTKVLTRAQRAVWPLKKSAEIPDEFLRRYMRRGVAEETGFMRVAPELRTLVRFERFNLTGTEWPDRGLFDLILCRNVLIYFDQNTKTRVLSRLVTSLASTGFLLSGHAESLINQVPLSLKSWAVGVYGPREGLPS